MTDEKNRELSDEEVLIVPCPNCVSAAAVDEAKLAEVVRVEMSKGAYEIVRGEKPYESSARWVAHAVAEWLRGELNG